MHYIHADFLWNCAIKITQFYLSPHFSKIWHQIRSSTSYLHMTFTWHQCLNATGVKLGIIMGVLIWIELYGIFFDECDPNENDRSLSNATFLIQSSMLNSIVCKWTLPNRTGPCFDRNLISLYLLNTQFPRKPWMVPDQNIIFYCTCINGGINGSHAHWNRCVLMFVGMKKCQAKWKLDETWNIWRKMTTNKAGQSFIRRSNDFFFFAAFLYK